MTDDLHTSALVLILWSMFSSYHSLPRVAAPCGGRDKEGSSTESPRYHKGLQT